MTYQGKVTNGVVVLAKGKKLPEGTVVSVRPLRSKATRVKKPARKPTTLAQGLLKLAGTVKGLPSDFSMNHDHYLYGTPKR